MKKKAKRTAYTVVDMEGGWGVGACVEGQNGYHPVEEYGPYTEVRAQQVVNKLNGRLGLAPKAIRDIVCSTMIGVRMSEPTA